MADTKLVPRPWYKKFTERLKGKKQEEKQGEKQGLIWSSLTLVIAIIIIMVAITKSKNPAEGSNALSDFFTYLQWTILAVMLLVIALVFGPALVNLSKKAKLPNKWVSLSFLGALTAIVLLIWLGPNKIYGFILDFWVRTLKFIDETNILIWILLIIGFIFFGFVAYESKKVIWAVILWATALGLVIILIVANSSSESKLSVELEKPPEKLYREVIAPTLYWSSKIRNPVDACIRFHTENDVDVYVQVKGANTDWFYIEEYIERFYLNHPNQVSFAWIRFRSKGVKTVKVFYEYGTPGNCY